MDALDIATIIISLVGLAGCIIFMISYQIRSDGHWWKTSAGAWNEIGIWLMFSRLNLAMIFALFILNRISPDWAGRSELTVALVALFALQTYWPSTLLWRKSNVTVDQEKEIKYDSRS